MSLFKGLKVDPDDLQNRPHVTFVAMHPDFVIELVEDAAGNLLEKDAVSI